MKVTLAYGKGGLALEVPPSDESRVAILRSKPVPAIADVPRAIDAALRTPIGAAPLETVARGRKSAVVVISDITRPVPNRVLLPPILETIERAGVPREAITILVATGIHRANEGDELVALVGPDIPKAYRVVNHVARDAGELVVAGATRAGIPVHVNRHYVAASLKVLTGFIEPHLWAGYSGGVKAILPGITGIETMKHMHGFAMIADPRTRYGLVEGNPFREAGLEVAAMVGVDFILNVTLNETKAVTGVFAGHHKDAFMAGVAFLEPSVIARVNEPVDLAITSGGGEPLDRSLYQTIKGMSGVAPILKPSGGMIVASACGEGAGSPEFTRLMDGVGSIDSFLARLRSPGFFEVDQWAAQEIYSIAKRFPVGLKSEGLAAEAVRRYHLRPVESVQAELDAALARGERVAIVPDGPYTMAASAI
jgi:nickel-dependent lactate racemase